MTYFNNGAVSMKVLWDTATCCLVEVYRCIRDAYYLHYRPEDGGSTHF
jgi:hypothetical protein